VTEIKDVVDLRSGESLLFTAIKGLNKRGGGGKRGRKEKGGKLREGP